MKKLYTIVFFCLFSIANALYLIIEAYKYQSWIESDLFCDINKTFSCSSIFAENFARIFGIPFPLLALIVYPIILGIAVYAIWKNKFENFKIILGIAVCGVCFNLYIIINESIIKIFCPSCLACTFSIVTIWILSFIWMKELPKKIEKK
jgi:uncharacterized membrane protein